MASPSGAKLAGKYGAGVLSLGATVAIGMDVLAHHWTIQEDVAAQNGQVADRDKWRLVGLMHLAETEEQARKDVEYGITQWFRYFQNVAAFPQMAVEGGDIDEMVDFVNGGLGVIGTPEQAVAQIEELLEQSNGGFGAYLTLSHNWANNEATKKSYELLARHVMPRFQGQCRQPDRRSRSRAESTPRTGRKAADGGRRGHPALRGRDGSGLRLTLSWRRIGSERCRRVLPVYVTTAGTNEKRNQCKAP